MGQYALPSPIKLTDSGPPPNANFHPDGKHQSLQGRGSPENRVLGYAGDEYLDFDTGDKWNKMGPTDEPRRATVDGWEVDAAENTDVIADGTTTPRNLADRFGDEKNVKDFGAAGDGSTNDTAALTAALAAVDAITDGVLVLPAGTFMVSQSSWFGILTIRGAGMGKTIIKLRSALQSTDGFISISGASSRIIVEDLTIDGDNLTWRCVRVHPGVDIKFERVEVKNALGSNTATSTTCGICVNGNGRFKFLNGWVHDITATANSIIGDEAGAGRGISFFQSGAAEAPPLDALVAHSTIENINPIEDGDGIAYQAWAQTTVGHVKIDTCHFRDCAKRAVKVLSPGGSIVNCDVFNSRIAASAMYSAFSIYTSDWKVIGNRALEGALGFGCEIGSSDWACNNVDVIGNTFSQGSDPNVNGRGIRVLGGAGTLTTGIVIADNILTGSKYGVHIAGGVVGCSITGNFVASTISGGVAFFIGQIDAADSAYADSTYVHVGGNTFNMTGGSDYGVRWKNAANCSPGMNVGVASVPFFSEAANQFAYQSTITIKGAFMEALTLGNAGSVTGVLTLGHATGANETKIRATPSAVAAITYAWPADEPVVGQFLKVQGYASGICNLEWGT